MHILKSENVYASFVFKITFCAKKKVYQIFNQ